MNGSKRTGIKENGTGSSEKNNRFYYTRLRSIYAESECLKCHGRPQDAALEMKAIYGIGGGYNYQIGEVVAADTVYIPVDASFVRIKEAAWAVFLIAIYFPDRPDWDCFTCSSTAL